MTDLLDLGRRLMAAGCPWRAGMLDTDGYIVVSAPEDVTAELARPYGSLFMGRPGIPDLSDAATRGAVLEALRERLGDPRAHLVPGDDWEVRSGDGAGLYGDGETEAAALVAAWEATCTRQ